MKKGIVIALILLPFNSFAASVSHQDSIGPVLFWITLLLFFGVLGRLIAKRLKQPGVLGELLMGVILGNLCYYFGVELMALLREGPSIFAIVTHLLTKESLPVAVQKVIPNATDALQVLHVLSAEKGSDLLRVAYIVNIFSSYGIIFLLFVTGLENSLSDLKSTGRSSMQVACIGVVAPICLGFFAMRWFFPEYSINTGIFIAATLCATSIGISAEVLKDLKILHSKEAKTILGAAMIDDILGLIVLAIVSSLVVNGIVHYGAVLYIVVATLLFFLVSIVVGPWILRQSTRFFKTLDPWEEKLFVSFLFLMFFSWLATQFHLSSIIGAFTAGIIIHEGFFSRTETRAHRNGLSIQDLIAPLEATLVPLFFMLIGIQVKLETFFDWQVLQLSLVLIVAAVAGKLVSGLGATGNAKRFFIGIGMLPRGEVGLIFASIGQSIGVISTPLFSAVVLMVVVTTFLAPIWLKTQKNAISQS